MTIGRLITMQARVAIAVGMVASLASPAGAQSASGAIASGSIAAAVDAAGTDVSVAGSLGFRFNRVMGLGVELTWLKLKTTPPSGVISPYTDIVFSNAKADALFFTTNVRVEIPTTSRRVLPYAIGGGGTASTANRYTVTIRTSVPPPLGSIPPGVVFPTPIPLSETQSVNSSSTGLALTLGGGVCLLVTNHISVDVDLRSWYIRGNPSGSIGRFGVGTSYRF